MEPTADKTCFILFMFTVCAAGSQCGHVSLSHMNVRTHIIESKPLLYSSDVCVLDNGHQSS